MVKKAMRNEEPVAKTKKSKATPTVVGIKDLEEKYGQEGKVIRQQLRKAGFSAPSIAGAEGFGPRSRYEWEAGSKELAKVEEVLDAAFAETAAKMAAKKSKPATKKSKAKSATPEPIEDSDEDLDEDEAEDSDEDEDDGEDED